MRCCGAEDAGSADGAMGSIRARMIACAVDPERARPFVTTKLVSQFFHQASFVKSYCLGIRKLILDLSELFQSSLALFRRRARGAVRGAARRPLPGTPARALGPEAGARAREEAERRAGCRTQPNGGPETRAAAAQTETPRRARGEESRLARLNAELESANRELPATADERAGCVKEASLRIRESDAELSAQRLVNESAVQQVAALEALHSRSLAQHEKDNAQFKDRLCQAETELHEAASTNEKSMEVIDEASRECRRLNEKLSRRNHKIQKLRKHRRHRRYTPQNVARRPVPTVHERPKPAPP